MGRPESDRLALARSRQYIEAARTPGQWLFSAEILADAGRLLWDHEMTAFYEAIGVTGPGDFRTLFSLNLHVPDLRGRARGRLAPPKFDVARLLMGLALENLAKGIRVGLNPDLVADPMSNLGGHNLLILFANTKLVPSLVEKQFLQRLTQAVLWEGRYPIPKTSARFGPRQHDLSAERRLFDELYARTRDHLRKLIGEQGLVVNARRQERCREMRVKLEPIISQRGKRTETGVILVSETERLTPTEEANAGITHAVVCVACGAAFSLSLRRRLAVCLCGTIHYASGLDDNGESFALRVETYRRDCQSL